MYYTEFALASTSNLIVLDNQHVRLLVSVGIYQPWYDMVFFSHNKPAPAGFISAETNQRTGWLFMILSFCLSSFYPIYMISYLAKYVGLKSYDVFSWTNHCHLKTIILLKTFLEFLKSHSWSCFFSWKDGFVCSFQPC